MFDIRDYGAVGGNRTLDTNAMIAALSAASAHGGTIYVPALNGGPAIIDAFTLADPGTGSLPIEIVGDGYASAIQVGNACTNYIEMQAGWCAIRNLFIQDTAGLCTNAYIHAKPLGTANGLERHITNVKGIGSGGASTAWLIECEGARNLIVEDFFAWNMFGAFHNKSGGVNSRISGGYGTGLRNGISIESDTTFGHQENGTYADITLECTLGSGYGVKVTDGLDVNFFNVKAVQLGTGTTGLSIDGTNHSVTLISFNNCYFEGSPTGKAVLLRGSVSEVSFNGGGIGQGGYTPASINGIDIDSAAQVTFQNFDAFFPLGNAAKIFSANSSSYKIVDCIGWDRTSVANTSTACEGVWIRSAGVPTVRSATDQYPDASWSTYTPTVVSSGAPTTPIGTATGRYSRNGKTVSVYFEVNVTATSAAPGVLQVSLPYTALPSTFMQLVGMEYHMTGATCTGLVDGSKVQVTKFDNTSMTFQNARIFMSGTYEIA
jgi:hypothetical protein